MAVDGDLYARADNGRRSGWYTAAVSGKAGRITAAGTTRDVAFEPADGSINDRAGSAYRDKYATSPYLLSMIGERARAATVRMVPVDTAA